MNKIYPFKFLDAYTSEDSQLFFGRNEEIGMLYDMVFQSDLILVYGSSGTGKTSLIQCGLASKFASHEWLPLFIRRGFDINQSLEKVLIENGDDINSKDSDLDWLDQDWTSDDENNQNAFSELSKLFRSIYLKNFKPIYLIFDQFEELFILGSKKEQINFYETIKEILQIEQPVKIIFSMREEYLGHLYEFERFVPELLRKRIRVESMTYEKIKKIIIGIGNLALGVVRLEQGNEDQFCEAVFCKIKETENKISIELPYLQVFLDKLYLDITKDNTRQSEAIFTLTSLDRLGDIGDVLQNFLDEQVVSATMKLNIERDLVWKILSAFVTIDGTKEPLSLKGVFERLPNTDKKYITSTVHFFENSRILRYLEKEQTYEIAHDSLGVQISARRSSEEIALLEVYRLIKYQTSLKEVARELLSAKQLGFIEPYLSKLILSDQEKDLIEQSRFAMEKEKALLRIRHKRIQLIYTIAVIVSFAFGFFAFIQKREADLNYIQLRKTNADSFFKEEEYSRAIPEYSELINSYLNKNGEINKKISECKQLDNVKVVFDRSVSIADSLSACGNTQDLLKADSIFKYIIALKYLPGKQRLYAALDLHKIQVDEFCTDNIMIAKTLIKFDMYSSAWATLNAVLKLQKDNSEAKELLMRIKK